MTTQEKIQNLLAKGFSRMEICSLTGLSMYQLRAKLDPEGHKKLKQKKREKQKAAKRNPRTKKVGRCGSCGGKVSFPCQLCKVRGLAATV